MRYLSFTSIAKRCPNGKWRDDETGQCIPKEEWQAKYHRDSPKQKTEEDAKNRERQEKINDLRRNYGVSDKQRRELKSFYDSAHKNPFERTEKGMKMLEKALDDESIPIDKVLKTFGMDQYSDGDSWTDLDSIKDPATRRTFLEGVKKAMEISPFMSASIPYISLDYMSDDTYGQTQFSGGGISLNSKFYTKQVDVKEVKRDYAPYEVMNPNGKKDTIAWHFTPENYNELSDTELIEFARKSTLTHEMGHALGGYLESLEYMRKDLTDYKDGANQTSKEFFEKNYEEKIKKAKERIEETLRRYVKGVYWVDSHNTQQYEVEDAENKIKEVLDEYESIIRRYWTWDMSKKQENAMYDEFDELEKKIKELGWKDVYVGLTRPSSMNFRSYNVSDLPLSYPYAEINVVEECIKVYKELYGLDDESFNPFDCYSEYGYYACLASKKDEPSPVAQNVRSSSSERIAEAYCDVCCRENPNTMSVLIVSAVNYNIYKAISGTDVSFRDYFFGDSMKEQREKMKDNRVIKRKKGCPEGMHTHPNRDDCHPISLRHRVGSMAWKDHVAMGLETPEGEEKPEEKKPEKKEPKKDEPKEKKEPDAKIKPYTKGAPKPDGLKYTMGFTRTQLKEKCPEYVQKAEESAKAVRDAYDGIEWDKVDASNVNDVVDDYLKKCGVDTRALEHSWFGKFNFADEPIECAKTTLENFTKVAEEYPYALKSFHGFGTAIGGVESYDPSAQTIEFNHHYFSRGNDDFCTKTEGKDPETGEITPWGFHYSGTTYNNCVQHEFGHLVDSYVSEMVKQTYVDRPQKPKEPEYKFERFTKETEDAMTDAIDLYLLGSGGVKSVNYDENYGTYRIYCTGDIYSNYKKDIKQNLKDKGVKGITSVRAYRSYSSNGSVVIYLQTRKIKVETPQEEEKGERKKFEGKEGWQNNLGRARDDEFKSKVLIDRAKECEEIYKKLYGVTKIIPSEVYSGYGYYGVSTTLMDGKKKRTMSTQASERMAEAFNDVMVRGDKANSMSQLYVAHLEYEHYQCMTGDFEKTFYDFIMNDVGKDKFKERIIKGFGGMRYIILNNAIAKDENRKRCPPGFHRAKDNVCRRLIDGEPVGEPYSESRDAEANREKKPRKEDKIIDARVNKIVSPDSREGKIVLAMKDGKEDDAVKSRKDYIKLVNEIGYYPVVIPIPDKFESYGKQFDGTRTTYDVFVDEDGNYSKKRKQLHDRIIAKYLNKMKRLKGDKQIMMFLGGGSASGKGSMDATLMQDFGIENKDDLEAFKIDPDAIMEELPEYEHFPPELRASACHREASDIAEALFYIAMRNGVSVIYDGTFSSEKPVRFAKSVDKDKYTMLYRGVVADPDDCVFFSNKRFVDGSKPKDGKKALSRIVPETVVRETNKGAREIRKKYVKDTDLFDDAKLFEENESRRKFYEENKDTYFK